ncbi:RNA 2',3'-cyclic phosphodiesterase [Patescibacteria group bacterium]|nr:RNA 2',3'-cyclic phosphodiesterase [Patescibacteria group bacterium]
MTTIRTFIAINLPTNIKKELAIRTENLKEQIRGDIKWIKPENFHLTLHFLGYTDKTKLVLVENILKKGIQTKKSFFLEIKKYGCFPHEYRPRVLFLDCDELENNYLIDLQKELEQELIKKIGLKVDYRPWQMHITFARLKNPMKVNLSKFTIFEKLKFEVKSIDLVKSELGPAGPTYTTLKSFFLN